MKKRRPIKVCTIGSATYDMFIIYGGADTMHLHTKNSRCTYMLLEQGTKINIPSIHYSAGGGGTNSAVGLARLGNTVHAYFKTGDDPAGIFIRASLEKNGVSYTYSLIDQTYQTALSVIIPSIEQDHVALCYRAANRQQSKDDFPLTLLKDLDLMFIGPLGGRSQELLPYITPAASNARAHVAINPSMIQLSNNHEQFIQTLTHVDTVIVNAHESAYLMKALLKEDHEPQLSYNSNGPALFSAYIGFNDLTFTIIDVVRQVLACGPTTVVITNGSEGVYVANESSLYFYPSIHTDPVYSLGAGDAFTSGFLGTLLTGYPHEQALLFGISNAHSVIQFQDAQEGLLGFQELEKKVTLMDRTKLIKRSLK